jgi:hypothetical protein
VHKSFVAIDADQVMARLTLMLIRIESTAKNIELYFEDKNF